MKKSGKKFGSKCKNRLLAAVKPCRPTSGEIDRAVRGALKRLSFKEQEVVEGFHFCGESCRRIGRALGVTESQARRLLRRGRRKLKALLAPFVEECFGMAINWPRCPVCRSRRKVEIEELLQTKTKEESWKRILRKLKSGFQIRAGARALKAHLKFHRMGSGKRGKGISSTCRFRTRPSAASSRSRKNST